MSMVDILDTFTEFVDLALDFFNIRRRDKKNTRNLVRILPAVVLMSVFVLFGLLSVRNSYLNSEKIKDMKFEMLSIINECDMFFNNNNRYPTNLIEVINGRPLRKAWFTDSWDNVYFYSIVKDRVLLVSKGADSQLGTKDDVAIISQFENKMR